MKQVYIEDIAAHDGEAVELRGWLYNMRSSKKLHFLEVRDGTGIIQCVMFIGDVAPELFESTGKLGQESSIIVRGTVRRDERSKIGYEVGVSDLEVVQASQGEYPISPKEHGSAFLLDHRHLWLRSKKQHAILRVRHSTIRAIRDYLDSRGFINVDAPIFTPNACEGTTTLFQTEYFGQQAYLSQSGQLYMEAAAMAHGRVYCFGPCFRAEKSKTRRHLTEFWMVEPEVAYLDFDGLCDLVEDFLVEVVARVLEERHSDLVDILERDIAPLERVKKPFPRISYTDAVARLKDLGQAIEWGGDFGGEDETVLTQQYDRPILVTRFLAAIKAFYMKHDPAQPELALGVDVLAPEGYGEIIGGGTREDELATLEQRIDEHNLPRDLFEWFLDLRRYGSVPHSGFGMGLERTVGWICGIKHLREASAFPRLLNRLSP